MSLPLSHSRPVARTTHRCDMCSRAIDPGERYSRAAMVGDDGFYTWKQCAHCTALLQRWGNDFVWDWHEGYSPDDVTEWEPDDNEAAQAKVMWQRRWRDAAGELYPVPQAVAS